MIILRFINSVVKEEIFNPIFCKQRAAKDSHDLHDRAIAFEVMFNDSNKTVGNDSHMDLDADGILRFSPKGLDLEMLLNPFEILLWWERECYKDPDLGRAHRKSAYDTTAKESQEKMEFLWACDHG